MLLLSLQDIQPFSLGASKGKFSSTLKTYASAWGGFVRFCEEQGVPPLPASPDMVTRYLRHRASAGKSRSAIRVDYSAIKAAHVEAGRAARVAGIYIICRDPTEDEEVKNTMRDLTYQTRDKRRPVNRIHSLTSKEFIAVKAVACVARIGRSGRTETKAYALKRGKVDIALISVMRHCILLREEVIRITWGCVEWRPDGSAELTVPSKKDNEIEYTCYLSKDTVRAFKAIRSPQGRKGNIDDSEERIFPMTTKSVSNRISAACNAAGL